MKNSFNPQLYTSCEVDQYFSLYRFVAYKLPKLESARGYVSQGIGYVYMDGETKNFTMPDKPINSSTSAIGHTLQQIYRQRSLGYIMYNDEDAAGTLNRVPTRTTRICTLYRGGQVVFFCDHCLYWRRGPGFKFQVIDSCLVIFEFWSAVN